MVNEVRLYEQLTWLTDNPERHRQSVWLNLDKVEWGWVPKENWECGTTACLAGWTVLHAGATPIQLDDEPIWYDPSQVDYQGQAREVGSLARTLLDLDVEQAERLFHHAKDLRAVWRAASEISEGRIPFPANRFSGGVIIPFDALSPDQQDWPTPEELGLRGVGNDQPA